MKYLKQIISRLKKKTIVCDLNWYVWLSLVIGILALGVGLYTLWFPINNIEDKVDELKYDYFRVYNEQTIDTKNMDGDEVIRKHYKAINEGDYQLACSLISTLHCSMQDVNHFTNWVQNKKRKWMNEYQDGKKVEKVIFSHREPNTNQEIWCLKDSFKINGEDDTNYLFWKVKILTRPDGRKEIGSLKCERAYNDELGERTRAMGCGAESDACFELLK